MMTPEEEVEVKAMLDDWRRIGALIRVLGKVANGIAKFSKWLTTVGGGTTLIYLAYQKWKGGIS